jgi:hypothetical protein
MNRRVCSYDMFAVPDVMVKVAVRLKWAIKH